MESYINYKNLFEIIKYFVIYSGEESLKNLYDYLKGKLRANKPTLLSKLSTFFSGSS